MHTSHWMRYHLLQHHLGKIYSLHVCFSYSERLVSKTQPERAVANYQTKHLLGGGLPYWFLCNKAEQRNEFSSIWLELMQLQNSRSGDLAFTKNSTRIAILRIWLGQRSNMSLSHCTLSRVCSFLLYWISYQCLSVRFSFEHTFSA